MIKTVMVINSQGKPRLLKFYEHHDEAMQQQIVKEIWSLVVKRPDSLCNFLEGSTLLGGSDTKLIYRHYATLYFIFAVDESESELGILDLIQVFVEAMDKCFENVCELDLIFHADKVHFILDEVITGGLVLETSLPEILNAVDAQNKMTKAAPPKVTTISPRR